MRNLITTLTCALLLSVAASAQVSDYSQLRTNSWSLYGLGGISTATGDRLFKDVNSSPDTYVAPMFGAGVTYNLRPWIRFNLGYETSNYRREQRLSQAQADGLSYRSLDMAYNDVEGNVEFNLAQIFRKKGTSGPFNVYLGTGIGGMFTYGADYTVRMGEEISETTSSMNDNYSFQAWLKAENDDKGLDVLYIPANLSAEYDITPRFTVGLRASAKYILEDNASDIATMTESIGALLRINFVGAKHGYTSKSRRVKDLESDLASATSRGDALEAQNKQLAKDMSEKEGICQNVSSRLDKIDDRLAALEKKLDDYCGPKEQEAMQYTVYFDNASAKLTKEAKATIEEAAQAIKANPGTSSVITASCSTPGGEAYNKALSDRRAEAVRKALINEGVAAERISNIVSLGNEGMTADASCRRAIIEVK